MLTALLGATATVLAACGGSSAATVVEAPGATASSVSPPAASSGARPSVIVTYPVLGAVVKDVVGDTADVRVLMPGGADPHEWTPSAKDVQAILAADLVVDNGLMLEGRIQDPLAQAKAKGVTVFTVGDHITVRKVKSGEGAEPEDPDQAPGADDPHLWTDPLTMKQWVTPFAATLKGKGVDVTARAARVEADLADLDSRVRETLAAVPAGRRKLVTGHESMGYFAERYGFQLIGAVIPTVTSQSEASARELADLTKKIKAAGIPAIFAEIGTPKATTDAVARDSGATVVELSAHLLPADGSYRTFMLAIATTVTGALK
ncbi:MAG: zinc/manganese transport system substrate-binding protein [Actinomycetota bacterium]|nr:zinc/manganese transport system substrate-binding protein [Actinomycetota bacterium]